MALSCITCGTALPDDADYCPSCGRAIVRRFAGDPLGPDDAPLQSSEQRVSAARSEVSNEGQSAIPVPLPPPQPVSNQRPRSSVDPPAAHPGGANLTDSSALRAEVVSPTRVSSPPPSPARPATPRVPAAPARPSSAASATASLAPGQPPSWRDRWLGAAAYLTLLPAIAFVLLKQFQRRQFVRFHAVQSILFWLLALVMVVAGIFVSNVGFLLIWLVCGILVAFAIFLTWLVLSIKALQGERFHLPWLGSVADQFGR